MLGRLGFMGRMLAIVLLVALALIALITGLVFASRNAANERAPRLPLPEQAAGIVALLEDADDARRTLILRAVNSEALLVRVAGAPPPVLPGARRLPAVEWLVAQYVEAAGPREVIAILDESSRGPFANMRFGGYFLHTRDPLKLAIAMSGGGYAVFETRGNIGLRLYGVPAGFWIGVLGAAVGLAAIWAVIRETRPLRALAASVQRFSEAGVPTPVAPQGAREIRSLIGAVNDMQARIATLLGGRTILLGAISHDLKTFITRLRLRIEQIESEDQRTRATRDLDDMTRLIDDALAAARGTASATSRTIVDLGHLLAADLEDRSAGRVARDGGDGPHEVTGDAVALRRVIANLIDNAVAFARTAVARVARDGELVVLQVDDDGPGIAPAHRALVFEPFFRADPSRSRATGGSGLGLAIAQQIVKAHGGTIMVLNSPLGGARLEVRLPAARA